MDNRPLQVLIIGKEPDAARMLEARLHEDESSIPLSLCSLIADVDGLDAVKSALARERTDAVIFLPGGMPHPEMLVWLRDLRALSRAIPLFVLGKGSPPEESLSEMLAEVGALFLSESDEKAAPLPRVLCQTVERKRAENSIAVRASQQSVIASLSKLALTSRDLQALMQAAVNQIAAVLNVEYCKILELLPGEDAFILRAGVGWREGTVGKATVGSERQSQAGFTLINQTPVIVEDLSTETRFQGPELLTDHAVISGLSVTIASPTRPYGVLGAHTTRRREFNADDVFFIQAIADILGAAIERERADRALRESEYQYRLLMDQASDAIFISDPEGRFDTVNDRACELLGYPRDELLSLSLPDLIEAADREENPLRLDLVETGRTTLAESRLRCKDGSDLLVEISATRLVDGRLQAIVRDITARRQAEESLQRQVDELTVLQAVALAGAEATGVDALIERATDILRQTLYPDNFGVLLLDETAGGLYLHPSYQVDARAVPLQPIPLGEGVTGQVAATGEPWRVPDVSREPAYIRLDSRIHSELCVPLKVGERVIGVINTESTRLDAFTEADERLLMTLAGQLATAIEKVRLFEAVSKQRTLYDTLRRVGLALNSTLELTELLNLICEESRDLFEVDATFIWLVQGEDLVGFAGYGQGVDEFIGMRLSMEDTTTLGVRVIKEQRAIFVNNAPHSAEVNRKLVNLFKIGSLLGVPLIKGDKTIGALMVIAADAGHVFGSLDVETAMLLGAQAAIAIENARLFDQERRRRQESETLRRAAEGMTATLELRQVLDRILVHLQQVVPYDSACLFLIGGDRLQAVAGRGFSNIEDVVGRDYPIDEDGLHVELFQTGRPLIIPDVRADPRFKAWGGTEYVRGWLGVPLMIRGTVIGYLTIDSRKVAAYGQAEAALAQALANQAAMAIDNARLFEEFQRQSLELQGLYDTALATSSVLVMESLLARLREQITRFLSPDSLGVFLYDEQTDSYEVAVAVEEGREIKNLTGARIPVDDGGLTGWVIRSRRPLMVDDLLEGGYPTEPRHVTRPARSWLGVPLIARDRLIGVISLQSFQPKAFTNANRRFLESLAAQVAIALENARLYERAKLEGDRREALNSIMAAAAGASDLTRMLETVLDQSLRALNLTSGGIWARDQYITRELPAKFAAMIDQVAQAANVDLMSFKDPVVVEDWRVQGDNPVLSQFASVVLGSGIRATLVVPIRTDGQQIGGLAVGARDTRPWSSDEIALLETVGSQVGAALERLRLFEEIQRRLQEVMLLSQVINITFAAEDMPSALERVCEEIARFLGVSLGIFAVINPARTHAEVIAEYHAMDRPSTHGHQIQIAGNPTMAFVLEHKSSLAVFEMQEDPRMAAIREFMRKREVASLLLVPVVIGEEVAGILGFDDREPRAFHPGDIALVEHVASQVSQALERMRLFADTQEHNRLMGRLATLSEALNRSFTEAEVVEIIGQGTYVLSGAEKSAVYVLKPDGDIACAWSRGLSGSYIDGVTAQVDDVPGGQMTRNQEVILLNDLEALPEDSRPRRLARMEGVRAVGSWPLAYQGKVIAGIEAYYSGVHDWSAAEREVMHAFARQAAVALENARLFDAEQRSKLQLTRSNALITALGRVAASIETARDPEEVIRTVTGELRSLQVQCLVALMGPDATALEVHYASIEPEILIKVEDLVGIKMHGFRLTPEQFSLYQELVSEKRPLYVADALSLSLSQVPGLPVALAKRAMNLVDIHDETAVIFSPLTIDERVLGVFGMWGGELQPDDVTAVSIFASQLAVALENARLYEAERRRRAELEALRQASLQLTSSLELKPVLEAILDQALKLVSADDAHVFLYDGERIVFGAAMWAGKQQSTPYSQPREGGLTYVVAQTSQRIVVPDVDQHALYKDYRWGGAIVGLPLKKGERVLGVMNIAFQTPHDFSEEELRVLELLADQAAIALENARLFEALQARVAELSVIAESSASLRGAANAQEIGQTLAEQAVRLVQAEAAWLSLVDENQKRLIPVGTVGMAPETEEYVHGLEEGIAGHVIRSQQVYYSTDVSTDPYTTFSQLFAGLGPGLCVPVRTSSGQVIGALLVARSKKTDEETPHFGPQSEHLLVTLAEIAGNSLQRSRMFEELELAYLETVLSLAKAMDARDTYTNDHSQRLASWAETVAKEMGCSDTQIQAVLWASLLHDIGKIGVPDHILRKPGPLTPEEWVVMKRHPEIGAEIITPVRSLANVVPIIRAHQEKFDGTGYPDGLRGDDIPLGARILAVVDAYSAMTDDRVYRKARSSEEAMAELQRCAGTQFDPRVVGVFLQVRKRGLAGHLSREDPSERAIRAHTTGSLRLEE